MHTIHKGGHPFSFTKESLPPPRPLFRALHTFQCKQHHTETRGSSRLHGVCEIKAVLNPRDSAEPRQRSCQVGNCTLTCDLNYDCSYYSAIVKIRKGGSGVSSCNSGVPLCDTMANEMKKLAEKVAFPARCLNHQRSLKCPQF